jgi:hypothetical protein
MRKTIEETIEVKVNDLTINVNHEGIKPYKDWAKDSQDSLKMWVKGKLDRGEKKGWTPFANFEAHVEFDIS